MVLITIEALRSLLLPSAIQTNYFAGRILTDCDRFREGINRCLLLLLLLFSPFFFRFNYGKIIVERKDYEHPFEFFELNWNPDAENSSSRAI